MRKSLSDECMEKEKNSLGVHVQIPLGHFLQLRKKTSPETRKFIKFGLKHKKKWQADWHSMQSDVDQLHRFDEIVSVVTVIAAKIIV